MPNPLVSKITITFSLDNNGNAVWGADPAVDVIANMSERIVWTLDGPSGATFDPQNGIVFPPGIPNTTPPPGTQWDTWRGQQPHAVDQTLMQYVVVDPNYGTHAPLAYHYNVTVIYQNQSYTWDPELENKTHITV